LLRILHAHFAFEDLGQRRETIGGRVVLVLEFAVGPVICRDGRSRAPAGAGIGLRNDGHLLGRAAGLEGVDRAFVANRRQDHYVAGIVDGQVHRIGRIVALDREAFLLAPAVDAVKIVVDEIELAARRYGTSGNRPEAAGNLFDLRPDRSRLHRTGIDVQHREFALSYLQSAGEIDNRVRVRELAGAKKRPAAVFVASSEAAFGIHMDVAEAHIVDVLEDDRRVGGL